MVRIKRIDDKGNVCYLVERTIAKRVFVSNIKEASYYNPKDAEKLVKWFENNHATYKYSIV